MCRNIALLLSTVFAFVAVVPPCSAQTREWAKRSGEVVADGEVHGKWSYIHTSDGLSPHTGRRLYKDEADNLLVIRFDFDSDNGVDTTTIEHLGTGEVVAIVVEDSQSITVEFDGDDVVVLYDDIIAEKGIPQGSKDAGATLIANASQDFRTALDRLAGVGCNESKELYLLAVTFADLLLGIDDCHETPVDNTATLELVTEFDPYEALPDEFEELFGGHYFE